MHCQHQFQLTIGSYVSVRSSRYEACGKFGKHERCVRVARGVASSNSSFLSASSASYLDERTADLQTKCFITLSTQRKIFFLRDLFADIMSVHSRNMKHAHTIEFD